MYIPLPSKKLHGVDGHVVPSYLEVQMVSGGLAGGAYVRNVLAPCDFLPYDNPVSRVVGVKGRVAASVVDCNHKTPVAAPSRKAYNSIRRRVDAGASGCRYVYAGVVFCASCDGVCP